MSRWALLRWALIVLVAASAAASDLQTPPWEKANAAAGRDLYRQNCAVCHDVEKDQKHTRKFGPSLNRLFQNPTLPSSHSKPNRAYVIVRIKFGGALMPAFAKQLNDSEINTLVNYLAAQ